MSEKTLTVQQHQTAIVRAHRTANKGQHAAGLAVFAAEAAGMLTFDRPEKGNPIPDGVLTRSSLAKVLGCSPTTVSKYRGIGRLDALGVKPGHADYTLAVASAAAAWMTEALDTGSLDTVEKALADHRAGSNAGSGGQKGKNVGGKAKGKKPQPASAKGKPESISRTNVEAVTARLTKWITANGGKGLDGLSAEALETVHALLMDAGEAVEAAQVRKGTRTAAPVAA